MQDLTGQRRDTVAQPEEPEPGVWPQANVPDQRLAELVRLLARGAAQQWYEEIIKGRDAPRS